MEPIQAAVAFKQVFSVVMAKLMVDLVVAVQMELQMLKAAGAAADILAVVVVILPLMTVAVVAVRTTADNKCGWAKFGRWLCVNCSIKRARPL